MSKHWDPAWKRGSVTVSVDPERATAEALARAAAGQIPPDFKITKSCMKNGVSRMAIAGPDFGAMVPTAERVRAAALQQDVGRFTWYFICTRPRITAVPGACGITDGRAELAFDVARDDGTVDRWNFSQPQEAEGVDAVEVAEGGELLRVISDDGPADQVPALVAQHLRLYEEGGWSPSDLDLEIEYIGRARGEDGSTSALDRLESHEKYQQVLEDLRRPARRNRDPWLVLSSGATIDTMTTTENPPAPDEHRQHELADMRARSMLTEELRIDLVEAMMINLYKPHLNRHHVETIDPKGSILTRCREAGLTGVALGISSAQLGVAYYTARRKRSQYGALKVCL